MANKTIGRQYSPAIDEQEVFKKLYKRGFYYYAGQCEHCSRKKYLDEYTAQEFVHYATPHLDKRSFWVKLWKKVPRLRLVVEKGRREVEYKPGWVEK